MPRRTQKKALATLFLPLVALFLLSIILVVSLLVKLPDQTEAFFGPPAPWLTTFQRYQYSALLRWQEKDLNTPTQPGGAEMDFSIGEGESVASITGRLWEAGLISNPGAFRTYLLYSGLDTIIKAGSYTFSPSLSPVQLAQAMQSATSSHVTFSVLPGWRAEEVAAALPASGLEITPEAFLQALSSPPQGYSFSAELAGGSLEGFLFPGSYKLRRDTSLPTLMGVLLDSFEANVTPEIRRGYEKQSLSLYEAVTLASIVSREAVVEDEMPMIASVFYNRLVLDMPLESDPTVQYALGYNQEQGTWWTNPLSLADLKVESPYNTYLFRRLPPGPIANPGLAALRAVAFPAQTPYYYFRAACDGSGRHLFAETYQQHLANACGE